MHTTDPEVDSGDRYSVPHAPYRAVGGERLPGVALRGWLRAACAAAGSGPTAGPWSDAIPALGRRGLGEFRPEGRGVASTWSEHAARLSGAIRQSAEMGPVWFRRAFRGDARPRHQRGQSRTWERRAAALHAWEAAARRGYCAARVLRAVDRVRRTAAARWGITVPPYVALSAVARWGDRQAVFAAVWIMSGVRVPGGFRSPNPSRWGVHGSAEEFAVAVAVAREGGAR